VIDSKFTDVEIAVKSSHNENSKPIAGGSIVIENVQLTRVGVAVQGPDQRVALAASPQITGWSASRSLKLSKFDPDPRNIEGAYRPLARPAGLITTNGQYYTRTKPQYANVPASGFLSARDVGALGDGKTDDTVALQAAIILALAQNKILFIDHGDYLVKSTIFIPAGARIVGEAYSVILSTGAFFNDIDNPQPVVQIGAPGEVGSIEWSDTIVSTQGQQRGAVLIQYNLASPTSQPSGLWDVHTRIGGFAGSELLLKDCPTTPKIEVTASNLNENCIAAYMSFHITPSGSGLYLENVWLWVADHDIEDAALTRITVYAGRGFLDQSTNGDIWLIGTSVEHHVKYEYQFANTRNVYMGQIQTETAYYQPNPNAQIPFPAVASLADPIFPRETITTPNGTVIPAADGWGLRIYQSQSIAAYGAGLYSFFNNYSTSCSDIGSFATCQNRIFSIEQSEQISFYNLNTVGTHFMVSLGGVDYPRFSDLDNGFISTLTVGQVQ
jgi:glucan 1,3-beta-glucosidase